MRKLLIKNGYPSPTSVEALSGRHETEWVYIHESPEERRGRAELLVQRYDLRASDALQLAAALEWCGDVPQGQAFLTFDRRLFQAALLNGFNAVGP